MLIFQSTEKHSVLHNTQLYQHTGIPTPRLPGFRRHRAVALHEGLLASIDGDGHEELAEDCGECVHAHRWIHCESEREYYNC